MIYSISPRASVVSTKICSLISPCLRRLNSTHDPPSEIKFQDYKPTIDAEPLYRYRPGGYHPIALGDVLKDGRYKILHKLGWGGFATTWAAKDRKDDCYVAIKIATSELQHSRELKVLRALSALPQNHPGSAHVNRLLDHFTLVGPNGTHNCLVLELVGPGVQELVLERFKDYRLPSRLAKVFVKQALQGLDFLAANNIGHGDLHTRNLAVVVPNLDSLNEEDFIARLGQPEIGAVIRIDGAPLTHNLPTHLTRSASFQRRDFTPSSSCSSIKIIDFGEAFFSNDAPSTLQTPLYLQAPEIVFGDRLDRRVDLWSAGCLIFELVTGQPPFDTVAMTPARIVGQMIEVTSDEVPSKWQAKWHAMQQEAPELDGGFTLKKWLEDVYFDRNKQAEFTSEEVADICEVVAAMLRFEPSLRATPSESLARAWFQRPMLGG
ncbi:related to dis1-suppressing protein kinase dsk1 [Claviceps purpurea 20.1]|uniref:non-specific serine/threonine protein kinase n=1 Tax=Claviceps purpurea (strain 20.1) TaxID=1111077 RepID=M1W5G4_CLAP2|nr:related to dis1-suppressing protein kinase dsk1 [Claviceps purpurea 20.1]